MYLNEKNLNENKMLSKKCVAFELFKVFSEVIFQFYPEFILERIQFR